MQDKILQIVIKAKDEATNVLKGLDAQLSKNKDSIDAIKKASSLAFASLVTLGAYSVKQALQSQDQQTRLYQLIKNVNGASDEQIGILNRQAQSLEKIGVVSAGNISIVQSQLATFDMQISSIERLTPAILDYAVAEKGASVSAEELQQMTNGLANALNGNFASLTATGFILDDATKKIIKYGTETEKTEAITKVLNSTYRDFNETTAKTFSGQLIVLKNQVNSLSESIGKILIGSLTQLNKDGQATGKGIEALSNATRPLQIAFYASTQSALILGNGLNVLGKFLAVAVNDLKDWGKVALNAVSVITSIQNKDFEGIGEKIKSMFEPLNSEKSRATSADLSKQLGDAMQSFSNAGDRLLNSSKNVDSIISGFAGNMSNLKSGFKDATGSTGTLTEAQKKQIEVLKRLKTEYSDFVYETGQKLIDLKEKHDSSINSIQDKIKGLRQSLADLQGDYERQKNTDVASIAQKIVDEEVNIADLRKKLASETSFEQIKAITEEIKAKQDALQSTAGFQSTIQAEIDEARRRSSLSDLERAIEDFNNKRVMAQNEYTAKQAEINAQIEQLNKQKQKENEIYNSQASAINLLMTQQKQHYEDTLKERYKFTQDYLDKELELYKDLGRQLDQIISKQQIIMNQGNGWVGSTKARAVGGGVQVGQSYLVGENGPEWFQPSANGSIVPNQKVGIGGGQSIFININGGNYMGDPSVMAEMLGDTMITNLRRVAKF